MFGAQLRCPKCNRYHPDRCVCNKPDKGQKGGSCNRTACQQPNANWFNHSTRAWYCEECAHLLNAVDPETSFRLFGHDLCTKGESHEMDC